MIRHYWRCRLTKGGPWVPAVTWCGAPWVDGEELDRSPRWQCLLRTETTARALLYGEPAPVEVENTMMRNLERITEAEYRYMIDVVRHAMVHAPAKPEAAPTKKIDRRGDFVW